MEISLDDWFKRQDNAVSFNRAEIENQYRWLDSAITLLTEVQLFVSDGPVVAAIRRKMQDDDATRYLATTLTVNLLNDALGSLISGTRLLLFGDLTDAFALVRCAFEGCAYAEYFVYHPDKAQSYMELETLLASDTTNVALGVNLGPELQRRGLQISTAYFATDIMSIAHITFQLRRLNASVLLETADNTIDPFTGGESVNPTRLGEA